jgi:hypothetical protein
MKVRIPSVLFSAMLATAGLATVSLSSCEEDKCKTIICGYGGTCTDGTCVCPSGYEGPQCETVNRDRFMGIWQATEDGTVTLGAQYPVTVGKGQATNEIRITNFYNRITSEVTGYVKGDTLRVPLQTIKVDNVDYTVQGIGAVMDDKYTGDHGKIVFNYSVTYIPNGSTNAITDDFGLNEGASSIWVH